MAARRKLKVTPSVLSSSARLLQTWKRHYIYCITKPVLNTKPQKKLGATINNRATALAAAADVVGHSDGIPEVFVSIKLKKFPACKEINPIAVR